MLLTFSWVIVLCWMGSIVWEFWMFRRLDKEEECSS